MSDTTWTLERVLSVPPVLVVDITTEESGQTVRRLRYSETPDLEVQGEDIVQLIDELERRRIRRIIDDVTAGRPILCFREPLAEGPVTIAHGTPQDLLEEMGLGAWIERLDTPCLVDLGPLN